MAKGSLEDRIAIRELHEAYADAVVRADPGDWGKVWTEDAHWELLGNVLDGRDNIVALWVQAMSGLEAVSFHCIPSFLDIDGDRATGRCQTQEIMRVNGGATRVIGGLYDDVMVRTAEGWRYSSRIFRVVAEYQPPKSQEGGA